MSSQESNSSEIDDTDADPSYTDTDTEKSSRKRQKHTHLWKQNIRKRNRNAGKAYISKSGNFVPKRTSGSCSCKHKCTEKFCASTKQKILREFNELQEKNVQDAYLNGLITLHQVQR